MVLTGRGADEAEQALDKTSRASKDAGESLRDTDAAADDASGGLEGAARSADKSASASRRAAEGGKSVTERLREAGNSAGRFGGLVAGVTVKVTELALEIGRGLINQIKRLITEFAGAEPAVQALNQALDNMGRGTEQNSRNLQAMATEIQRITGISDTDVLESITRLLQFGVDPENMRRHIDTVQDLAGLTGDLRSATQLYERALQGQLDSLSEYGIVLERTGDRTKDLEALQRIAAERGGGQLEARAKSLSGQWRIFTAEISDTFKGVGNLISRTGILQATFSGFQTVLEGINSLLPGFIRGQKAAGDASEDLARKMEGAIENLRELSQERLDTAIAEGEELRDKMAEVANSYDEARRRRDEFADAELARRIAELDLEEQRALAGTEDSDRRNDIQREFAQRRAAARAAVEEEKRQREVADAERLAKKERDEIATNEQVLQALRASEDAVISRAESTAERLFEERAQEMERLRAEARDIAEQRRALFGQPARTEEDIIERATLTRRAQQVEAQAAALPSREELQQAIAEVQTQEKERIENIQSEIVKLETATEGASKSLERLTDRMELLRLEGETASLGREATGLEFQRKGEDARREREERERADQAEREAERAAEARERARAIGGRIAEGAPGLDTGRDPSALASPDDRRARAQEEQETLRQLGALGRAVAEDPSREAIRRLLGELTEFAASVRRDNQELANQVDRQAQQLRTLQSQIRHANE